MLEASIERGDVRHKASMLLMDNAVLVLFYEEPMRIGTLAFSTPGLRKEEQPLLACFLEASI